MYEIKVKGNLIQCGTCEEVFNVIKEFSDNEIFWDEVINDEVGEDFYAFGNFYKPADVLKAVDRNKFDEICKQFWVECEQDVLDEIEDIRLNEVVTIYGFEVRRCSR